MSEPRMWHRLFGMCWTDLLYKQPVTVEVEKDLSQKLQHALGDETAAVHWDLARATLKAANGMPTLVGLAADPAAAKLQSAATSSAAAR